MALLLRVVAVTFCGLGLVPLIGLLLSASSDEGFVSEFLEIWDFGSRTARLAFLTAYVALVVSFASASYSVIFAHWASKGRLARRALGGFHVAVFFISPFVFTQGWINLLGTGGFLEEWFQEGMLLPSIYSTEGWTVISIMQFIPLGLLVVWLTRRPLSRRFREDATGYEFNLSQRVKTTFWMEYRRPFFAALSVVFLFSFWNWEIPSMLRQSSFPLEVMSFFGSFYDYGSAIALAIPPLAVTTCVVAVLISMERRRIDPSASTEEEKKFVTSNRVGRTGLFGWIFFGLFPTLALLIPVVALALRAGSWGAVERVFALFPGDIPCTLVTGITVGVTTTAMAVIVQSQQAVHVKRSVVPLMLPWVAIALPGILSGIGMAKLFSEISFLSVFSGSMVRLVVCEIVVFTPLAIVGMSALSGFWKKSWTEHAEMTGNVWLFFQVGLSAGWVQVACLILAISSLVMREVPVALSNFPPGASTVALTIETVLHFDQPQVVSVLCLIQLSLIALLWILGGGFILFVKHILNRRDRQPNP